MVAGELLHTHMFSKFEELHAVVRVEVRLGFGTTLNDLARLIRCCDCLLSIISHLGGLVRWRNTSSTWEASSSS